MQLVAKTFFGLEEVLSKELENLGAKDIKPANRAVYFAGDKMMLYKSNYMLRTALSVLKPIHNFSAYNEQQLYDRVQEIDWVKTLGKGKTFAIESTVYSKTFKHSQFIALKAKDAIVDQFRRRTGSRPDINSENPDILINLHISETQCTISLNSSGEPLFKRGYRVAAREAPLNEVLAAGMIQIADWGPDKNLVDFMCGSGTILIEAAMLGNNTPAGFFREKFGFENWPDFEISLFSKIKSNALQDINNDQIQNKIIGNDISRQAINSSKFNIKKAGLETKIDLVNKDFSVFDPPANYGMIITNPPYGERMTKDDITEFYKSIGNLLKTRYQNFTAWILTSNLEAIKFLGLHPSKKIKLMNAALECTFNKYEIYEGSKKSR